MTALDGVHGTVCSATQYEQSQQSYGSRSPWISCLTHGDIIGLILAAEASLFSCICVLFIFIRIGRNVLWYRAKFPSGDWELFRGPVDIYMFSLFVFDLLQTTGGILNVKWANDGIVTSGPYCTAQGIVEQIGDLGVALITLLLAVHTFVTALWHVGLKARRVALTLVCLICVFITLWVTIAPSIHKRYETPTPYWCWISPQFPGERLGGEYIWMWIALFASILYIPLHFWAQGFLWVENGYKFHWSKPDQRIGYAARRTTLGMLLYPLSYSLIVLPISITRWLLFSHHHVSSAATFFANSLFYFSGAINVLLFLIIRPGLLLFPRPKELDVPEIELAPQGTEPAIISDTAQTQPKEYGPEPSSAALGEGGSGSRDNAALSPVNSRRISDDI